MISDIQRRWVLFIFVFKDKNKYKYEMITSWSYYDVAEIIEDYTQNMWKW